ncbi:hypothetical protein HOC35_03020 [Candidatus Woesearchaeota archaeon]|jgi:hypothetical protein|nr:hypothetical protein [Candidatus Woesearchaeota archaeon]
MWKKVLETKDIMAYEKKLNELDVRIEARQINDEWKVYVKYFNSKINFTDEYDCENLEKTKELIFCLKNTELKSVKEIIQLKLQQNKEVKINLKRTNRDYNSESWIFGINDESPDNKVIVRETDFIEVEVILGEMYKVYEERILEKLVEMLGLSNQDVKTKITVYYCKKKVKYYLEEGYMEEVQKC